jgi:hypothetical protein
MVRYLTMNGKQNGRGLLDPFALRYRRVNGAFYMPVEIALSLMAFVLKLGINLGKDRVRAKGEMIRDQDLLGIPSSDELRPV